MNKPGRNDPCPCGSGRKYKRCCLGREVEHDRFAEALEQRALPRLSQLARFAETAMGVPLDVVARSEFAFWRTPLDEAAAARVVDHLMFDVRLERYGRTAIDQFVMERAPAFDAPDQAMVKAWSDARRLLYRVDGWSAGFLRCAPVLEESGASINVWPLGRGAGVVADGAPVALRALTALDAYVSLGRPVLFGSRSVEDVAQAVKRRHLDFVRNKRIVGIDEFLRLEPKALDEEAAVSSRESSIIVPGA